jgi:hypothetical protein
MAGKMPYPLPRIIAYNRIIAFTEIYIDKNGNLGEPRAQMIKKLQGEVKMAGRRFYHDSNSSFALYCSKGGLKRQYVTACVMPFKQIDMFLNGQNPLMLWCF